MTFETEPWNDSVDAPLVIAPAWAQIAFGYKESENGEQGLAPILLAGFSEVAQETIMAQLGHLSDGSVSGAILPCRFNPTMGPSIHVRMMTFPEQEPLFDIPFDLGVLLSASTGWYPTESGETGALRLICVRDSDVPLRGGMVSSDSTFFVEVDVETEIIAETLGSLLHPDVIRLLTKTHEVLEGYLPND